MGLFPPNPGIKPKQELSKTVLIQLVWKGGLYADAVIDLEIPVNCYEKTLSTSFVSDISEAPKRERFENTDGNDFCRSRDFLNSGFPTPPPQIPQMLWGWALHSSVHEWVQPCCQE